MSDKQQQERLAAALRENLKKRKEQAREREIQAKVKGEPERS